MKINEFMRAIFKGYVRVLVFLSMFVLTTPPLPPPTHRKKGDQQETLLASLPFKTGVFSPEFCLPNVPF